MLGKARLEQNAAPRHCLATGQPPSPFFLGTANHPDLLLGLCGTAKYNKSGIFYFFILYFFPSQQK